MDISAYIAEKLQVFGTVTDSTKVDIALAIQQAFRESGMVGSDAEVTPETEHIAGKALVYAIANGILAPHLSSISESGFSMSWDYTNLSKYYLYLCRRYGVTPNEDLASIGVKIIRDKTDMW